MLLQLKINDQTFIVVNLHSPNKDDPDFYDRVMGELKNTSSQELILTGDWNRVLNPVIHRIINILITQNAEKK